MCRIRALTGPVVLAALFATTPQLAFGQEGDDEESPVEITCRKCIVGNEIASGKLGEFLSKNLNVKFMAKKDEGLAWVERLRLEMISREKGVVGKWESKAVEVEGDKTYSGATWLGSGAGFMEEVKVTYVVKTSGAIKGSFRECGDATHAVRITLVSDDERFVKNPTKYLCLTVEG